MADDPEGPVDSNYGLTYYTRDPSGQILNEHGASGTRHYLGDYQSSVTAMVSTTGPLMATYAYEPYGKATVNAQSGGTTATDNPWRYTGGYYDTEGDGNYHLGARYYDTAGHFTQPDSLQGNIEDPKTLNSYGYTGGDPINRTDPSGKSWDDILPGAAAGGGYGFMAGAALGCVTGGIGGAFLGVGAGAIPGCIITGGSVGTDFAVLGVIGGGIYGGING